jgi:septal ring factor EnvC (AmiA/AmiB activator)
MILAPDLNCEAVRETFEAWNAERDSLDTELSQSLVALEAYQSHLDSWQLQLAAERGELQAAREQFELEQTSAEKNNSESSAATIAELHAAREKITALTTLLLSRTEELRTLDNSRAETQTELELSRAREREAKAALEEQKRSLDHERSQWSVELKQLREAIENQLDASAAEEPVAAVDRPAPVVLPTAPTPAPPTNNIPTSGGAQPLPGENPLLGSIVEQFGKLRQQRAIERQANNRKR